MVRRQIFLFTLLLLITLSLLGAAENTTVMMNLLPTLTYNASTDSWKTFFNADLSVTLASKREGNVRGEVILKTNSITQITSIDDVLYKAYFKARFPSFRLTGGKTRLSWGDGMLFNAGDVLYGSSATNVLLTQAELRSTTDWLASINYPLGSFSFIEAVAMPSKTNTPSETLLGIRFYTVMKEIKVEGGYVTMQEAGERLHKPYISLQGNLGFDWYLSSSLAIANPTDSWMISGGLFHLVDLTQERSLALRLEFLVRPLGSWQQDPINENNATLLFYPEVSFSYTPSLSFTLRSIISPLDFSANSTFSLSWNVSDTFNLLSSISVATGEDGDLFAWNSIYSFAITVGSSWIF